MSLRHIGLRLSVLFVVGAATVFAITESHPTPIIVPVNTPWTLHPTFTGCGTYYPMSMTGTLPTGISFNNYYSFSPYLSGPLTSVGTYTFQVFWAEWSCGSGIYQATYTITVVAPPSVNTASLPNGLASTAYSTTLSASGGTAPLSWSITAGSPPTGLALAANGTISGTPTAAGTFNFTVKCTDSTSPTPQTSTKALSITIGAALSVTTASLASGIAGAAYSMSLAAAGGTPGYSWGLASGLLPPGLSLSGSTISGTPSTAGTFNFTVLATDSTSPTAQTAARSLSISIGAAISITTTSLPSGLAGSPYSTTVTITGGSGSYTGWGIWAGGTPPGVANGSTAANPLTISGTPSTPGTYPVTWANCDAVTSQCASQALSITIGAGLSIATASLPSGLATTAYSNTLSATGGTAGYSWTVTAGTLPTGLTLAPN